MFGYGVVIVIVAFNILLLLPFQFPQNFTRYIIYRPNRVLLRIEFSVFWPFFLLMFLCLVGFYIFHIFVQQVVWFAFLVLPSKWSSTSHNTRVQKTLIGFLYSVFVWKTRLGIPKVFCLNKQNHLLITDGHFSLKLTLADDGKKNKAEFVILVSFILITKSRVFSYTRQWCLYVFNQNCALNLIK